MNGSEFDFYRFHHGHQSAFGKLIIAKLISISKILFFADL